MAAPASKLDASGLVVADAKMTDGETMSKESNDACVNGLARRCTRSRHTSHSAALSHSAPTARAAVSVLSTPVTPLTTLASTPVTK
ncbi:unannotated protein [freshwater metagenome]|uniref:Unannotated protein n=1 Tax=freshwater metagenome TaxID=449393 RepID=A0A6J7IM36_9ZZZZ